MFLIFSPILQFYKGFCRHFISTFHFLSCKLFVFANWAKWCVFIFLTNAYKTHSYSLQEYLLIDQKVLFISVFKCICMRIFIRNTPFSATKSEVKTFSKCSFHSTSFFQKAVSFLLSSESSTPSIFVWSFVCFLLNNTILTGSHFSFQERSAIYWNT